MVFGAKLELPSPELALPGRAQTMLVPDGHFVHGQRLVEPFPPQFKKIQFAMGCFWGAERRFWQMPGVFTTAVGYSGGITPNPSYEEVCSGGTGHTESVLVVYDESKISLQQLLRMFWESHNPTEGMRQGNDMGTQYRSAIYTYDHTQLEIVLASQVVFQQALISVGYGKITTEIKPAEPFYYAEHYHQQYLAKVPNGYCGLAGTGVSCEIPTGASLNG
jgi:peptide-methionine (S)-S-oxide reductase